MPPTIVNFDGPTSGFAIGDRVEIGMEIIGDIIGFQRVIRANHRGMGITKARIKFDSGQILPFNVQYLRKVD
jgi:hypothetical protein